MSRDVSVILGKLSSIYVKVHPGELGIGTTKLNEKDFFEEDLNSISDLAAGTLSEFFDKVHSITDQNSMGDFAYKFPQNLTDKAQYLIDWVSEPSSTLKKVTVVFDRGRKTSSYKIWRFDVKNDPRYT
jgi:capsule polysaccharide export protein KpsC/LpsZ